MTQAQLLNQEFNFHPVTDRFLLPHRYVWDVNVSSASDIYTLDFDYSVNLTTGEIVRLLDGRINQDLPVLISYIHAGGVVSNVSYLFNLDNLVVLPHTSISGLVVSSPDPIAYKRDTDYTLDSLNARITRLTTGKISKGESVNVDFSFFGKLKLVERLALFFNEVSEIQLPNKPAYNLRVERLLPDGTYQLFGAGVDYEADTQQGIIDRVLSGAIGDGETVYVSYEYPFWDGLYLNPDEFIASYGLAETIELTNLENPEATEPNFSRLATAIELMSGEMDIFLDNYFALPLNPVTEGMKWKCGVLVRYHLDHNREREDVRKRYKDVMAQLRAIAKGDLGSGSEGEGQQSKVGHKPGYRIFTQSTLAGY